MLPKRYIAIKNNPRWLPPTLLMWALGPGALLYSTQKGLFMSLSLLCSIHKWKDTRSRLDMRQADPGTRQSRGLTLMTLSLCLRSEHSATWNVLPWRRRVSRRSSTKPSSLFSTPRKKRKAALSAIAAVQLSEVTRDPSPAIQSSSLCDPAPAKNGGQDRKGLPASRGLACALPVPQLSILSATAIFPGQSIHTVHGGCRATFRQCLGGARSKSPSSCISLLPSTDVNGQEVMVGKPSILSCTGGLISRLCQT